MVIKDLLNSWRVQQRRVLYIVNNCLNQDWWRNKLSFTFRLFEAKAYVTKNLYWPMRNLDSDEFYWPLTPDPKAHWSVYATDSSVEMEGYSCTAGQKRALDDAPQISPPFKRQLRFEENPKENLSSRRKAQLLPIKTFLQRSPDTFPIPAHITKSSASKPRDSLEAEKGTCTLSVTQLRTIREVESSCAESFRYTAGRTSSPPQLPSALHWLNAHLTLIFET